MRMLKKMISVLLVLCMVISMVPAAAAADSAEGRILLDASVQDPTVWVDGIEYPVQRENGSAYVALPEGTEAKNMVTYTNHVGDAQDVHTQYPTGMQVWILKKNSDGSYTPKKVEELTNILQYSGSSIRIVGKKGIRMITSLERTKKNKLTTGSLAGFKLLEYGTVLAWSRDLAGGNPLILGQSYARSNYAYKKGVADPVFGQSGNLVQYTNVLVDFTMEECKDDIAMRPYMILEDGAGQQMTIYGGIVHRSIGYIAWQNKDVFTPGSAAYNYIWEIIRHIYAEVSFDTNGGSTVEPVLVRKGGTIEKPADPEKAGDTFCGWYKDEALTQEFDFTDTVYEDLTLHAKWEMTTPSDLSVKITNSNYRPDTKSIITPNDSIVLTGTVTGVGEVQNISAAYRSYGGEETSVQADGTNEWSCQLPLETGTNEVTVSVCATDGAITQTTVYVNRTSREIAYKQTVKVVDPQDYATVYNDTIGCWCDDNGTELAADDTIVMLVRENALLLDQIDDELVEPGDLFMIPDNNLFTAGFSGVYKFHRAPEGCADYPAESYPDSEYEEIVFDYPGFSDLFEESVSLDFSAGVDDDDPIAFAMAGDGSTITLNSSMPMSASAAGNGSATYANTYYGEPGWQTEELISSIIPSVFYEVDDYGRLKLGLKWKDIVVYDDDGKKNPSSGIEADKGQLKLSGEYTISNLKYTGGMEWHPSFVPWDIELLPQQMISKLEYTQEGSLELKGGVSASTADLVKKINHYRNQKEFWGMKVNGVKTFETKVVLCIIGVNLAPIAVKPYKTLRGLAAASTMTTPKLFLYFFLDADGNITVEGSLNLKYSADAVKGFNVQKNGYVGGYGSQDQNRGDKHYQIGSTHTLDVYDTSNDNGNLTLKLKGKLSASFDIGPGFGAGLMICGVCPATVDGELFYRARGEAEGEIQFLPVESELGDALEGYAGLYHGVGFQTDITARAILKTKIGDTGLEVNKHYERMFWEEDISTSKFDGTVYAADEDDDNSNNPVVSGASVILTKLDTLDVWTTTTDANGKYVFGSIPDGEYSLLVQKEGFDGCAMGDIVFEKKKTLDVFLKEHNPWNGICVLSGKIVVADTDTDMTNNQPLSDAQIELRNNSNNAAISVTTDADGTYKFENIPAGNYTITIRKEGYISIFAAVSVAEDIQNVYNATMEAISEVYTGEGIASGTIYDALTGYTVPEMTLNIREGIGTSSGTIVQTITTDGQGKYTTPYMSAGNYTVEVVDNRPLDNEDARYLTTTFSIKILGNQSIPNQDGFVTNGLMPDQLRIVLKWGAYPNDLDSHMVGPTETGGRFHTFYRRKEYYSSDLMANLDLDNTEGYGPETTTIYETSPGIYTFLVHDYTNKYENYSMGLANSGAYVEVFLGASEIVAHRFDVPNLPGTLWTVFSYNAYTGEILPINTMSYHGEETGDIGLSIPVQEGARTTYDLPVESTDPECPLKDYELEENAEEPQETAGDPAGDLPGDPMGDPAEDPAGDLPVDPAGDPAEDPTEAPAEDPAQDPELVSESGGSDPNLADANGQGPLDQEENASP